MTDNVIQLTSKEPKSPEAMVELLRGVIDRLYDERITYLEISYKGEHDTCNVSIVSP